MTHRCRRIAALLAVALGICGATSARADIYVLTSGGQVRGELMNPTESPRKEYVIRTDDGATVTFDRKQLKQIVPQSAAEVEYEKIRPTFADTVDGQWKLSEWCAKNSLPKQRNAALERVIELDPNHKLARTGLGYGFIEGKWFRREEWQKENGKVLYKGDWYLPQEVELIKSKRESELASKKWFVDLRKWRGWLNDPSKAAEAEEKLKSINEPAAVPAILKEFDADIGRPLQLIYVQALGRIYANGAVDVLIGLTINNPDIEVRLSALDELVAKPHPNITSEYVKVLRDRDNVKVNRAALALGKLGDKSAIRPLIDALVTTHKYSVTSGQSNPNGISTGFGSDGSGGLSMGSSTRVYKRDLQNQAVLDALVTLAGQNFDFDEVAWRTWYAAQNKAAKANPRRD
jgi:hypothetical protein